MPSRWFDRQSSSQNGKSIKSEVILNPAASPRMIPAAVGARLSSAKYAPSMKVNAHM